jgi:uncharacterized protein YjdB
MNNKLTLTLLLSIFILLTGLGSRAQISGGCLLTPSTATVCAGASITFSSTDAYSTEIWTPSLGTFTTVPGVYGTGTYTAPSTAGTYTLTYNSNTTLPIYPDICTATITVIANTTAPPITGTPAICSGDTVLFTDGLSGGAWNSSNGLIASTDASGNVTGVAPGTAIISYMPGVTCGVAATYAVEIDVPFALITGSSAVCSGGTTTLNGWSPGGTWSGGTPGLALIGHHSGVVTTYSGISGTTTFTYSSPANACGGPYSANWPFAVDAPITTAGAVTTIYPTAICVGASTYYSDGLTGGTFTSDNTAVATVDPVSGTVTGVSAGTANIGYYLSNSCGTVYATTLGVTVNPLPNAGTIYGTTDVCVGGSGLPLYSTGDPYPTGTWSATGDVSINVATGVMIAGASAGSATVTYASSTATCGAAYTTTVVTVDALPAAITGTSAVCPYAVSLLSDAVPGGAWSSSDPTIAIADGAEIQGITGGTVNITYTLTNGCGTNYATTVFTVYPAANAGTISGTPEFCATGSTTLTHVGGDLGTWSPDGSGIDMVDALGRVTAISAGTATISYNVTSIYGCTAYTTYVVTIDGTLSAPPAIDGTGFLAFCNGTTMTLTDATYGGSWSSGNTAIATIDPVSGVAYGVIPGSAMITYTITNTCGSAFVTASVQVEELQTITITPTYFEIPLCVGSTYPLTATPAGGTWSTWSIPTSTVSSTGVVTAVEEGDAVILYDFSNSCGASTEGHQLFFNEIDMTGHIIIGGPYPSPVCNSTTTNFTCDNAGNDASLGISSYWSLSSPSIGSLVPDPPYAVGVSETGTGPQTLTLNFTNVCGSAYPSVSFTVIDVPSLTASPPTLTLSHTGTATISLSPGATYYTWSSSNMSVADFITQSINSAKIEGLDSGTSIITYTGSNSCGSSTVTVTVTVP